METTGKVKLKAKPFKYIMYDGMNCEQIRDFIGKSCSADEILNKYLLFWKDSKVKTVSTDCYFVKDENGNVSVYSKEEFKQTFEPWDLQDDLKRIMLFSQRHCEEDECLVMDDPHQMMATEKIPVKKKRSEVTEQDDVVRCVICHEPATQLDHLFPVDTMDNRCTKHARSLIDPCAWENYGTAVEVCQEHYDFLGLKDKIEDRLDWLDKNDKSVTGNALRDKLVAALKELDSYMKTTWPSERMGTRKEEEAKTGK